MKHVGDITKLSGYTLPAVDIITGGSPCQDLSVAGKRAGLAGERSGLFMEQIRIVKEMRDNDIRNGADPEDARPRYMVWENVPGAFSSNGGKDFQAVLTEIARVAEPDAPDVPLPEKGKWSKAGCLYGAMGEWSVAWRVHDAQFWGVPQRRKRISLVADFGGLSAPEILFEREGLSGDPEPSGEAGQEAAGAAGGGVDGASGTISFQERGGKPGGGKGILIQHEHVGALSTLNNQRVCSKVLGLNRERCGAVTAEDLMPTLQAAGGTSGNNKPMVCYGVEPGAASCMGGYVNEEKTGTLRANMGDNQPAVCYGISSYDSNAMKSPNPHSGIYEAETARTLDLNGGSPACNQGGIAVVQSVGCDGYNQEVTGDVAASLTAASGGTNTSGLKVIAYGFEPGAAKRLDTENRFVREKTPTLRADMGDNQTSVLCLNDQGGSVMGVSEDVTGALRAEEHGHQPVVAFTQNQRNEVRDLGDIAGALAAEPGVHQQTYVYENHSQDSRFRPLGDICQTVSATYGMGGNNQPLVVNGVLPFDTTQITSPQNGSHPHYGDPCHPLAAGAHPPAVAIGNGQLNQVSMAEQANTLDTMHDQQAVMVAAVDCRNGTENPNINGTLQAKSTGGTGTNFNNVLRTNAIVRRLTPLECERLQGYPDGWTDIGEWVDSKGKKHKDADSPRYKALGNSIALPFWQWMARRICAQYERTVTMASLFDGIGGFPLVFSRCGATPVWASEIEEFPIAVTKVRFPDEPV